MSDGAFAARVTGNHLRDEKDFVPTPLDRFPDQALGFSGAVELCGIDVREAQVERRPYRCNRGLPVALLEVPGAEPNLGDMQVRTAEHVSRKLLARHWRALAR